MRSFNAILPTTQILVTSFPARGGLRKIRVSAKGKGKRGGARVIYFCFVGASRIAMLLAYPKNAKDDLDADEKKALAKIIKSWRT